jgi:hypothetical protein
MSNVDIQIDDLKQRLIDAIDKPIWKDDLMKELTEEVDTNLKNELSWTQNLKNNILTSWIENSIIISMPLYGLVIDKGRRPGAKMPPVEAIKSWCKEKAIPEEAAWPIAISIKTNGIAARPFIKKSLNLSIAHLIAMHIKETLNKK